jgi:hypothetical protein
MNRRFWAAQIVANNWRVRRRLPRVTAFAKSLGLIPEAQP